MDLSQSIHQYQYIQDDQPFQMIYILYRDFKIATVGYQKWKVKYIMFNITWPLANSEVLMIVCFQFKSRGNQEFHKVEQVSQSLFAITFKASKIIDTQFVFWTIVFFLNTLVDITAYIVYQSESFSTDTVIRTFQ